MMKVFGEKRGAGIFEFIIIIAIVAILGVVTLPNLNNSIAEKGTNAIDRIDTMDEAIDQ